MYTEVFIHSFIYKNRYVRVSGRGIRFLDNSLHTVRSVAIAAASSGSKPALRISASLWSFHLVLGLPTGRCPSGSASNNCLTNRSTAILSTWPRRSYDLSTQRSSGSTLMTSLIQVFLTATTSKSSNRATFVPTIQCTMTLIEVGITNKNILAKTELHKSQRCRVVS